MACFHTAPFYLPGAPNAGYFAFVPCFSGPPSSSDKYPESVKPHMSPSPVTWQEGQPLHPIRSRSRASLPSHSLAPGVRRGSAQCQDTCRLRVTWPRLGSSVAGLGLGVQAKASLSVAMPLGVTEGKYSGLGRKCVPELSPRLTEKPPHPGGSELTTGGAEVKPVPRNGAWRWEGGAISVRHRVTTHSIQNKRASPQTELLGFCEGTVS